jgi:hypothetical protein
LSEIIVEVGLRTSSLLFGIKENIQKLHFQFS